MESNTKSTKTPRTLHKEAIIDHLSGARRSAVSKYRDFFVGKPGWWSLLKFELITSGCCARSGAFGYLLRKQFLPHLMAGVGPGVQWGRNLALRHPYKMQLGEGTAIDDDCLLDARAVEPGRFRIGRDVLIARNVAIQSKTDLGFIEIGDDCSVGNNCTLSSAGGIRMGAYVGLGGHCFLGGARYQTDRQDVPMLKQPMYSTGPIEIGDNCWIGAGVRILDGARIGAGCIIGAGSVIREDVPPNTMVTPHQRLVMLKRERSDIAPA